MGPPNDLRRPEVKPVKQSPVANAERIPMSLRDLTCRGKVMFMPPGVHSNCNLRQHYPVEGWIHHQPTSRIRCAIVFA